MKRIDTSTVQADKHGAGKDGFTDGDPGVPINPTDLDASWYDNVQEEIATVVEASGAALNGLEFDQLLKAIQKISDGANRGALVGRLLYESASEVRLQRGLEAEVRFEIDGDLLTSGVDLVWDITADLDVGSEAASTWYYPYLENVAGVLTPRLSAVAPVMDPAAGKVGYHPDAGKEGWRAVPISPASYLAVFNDAGSDLLHFDVVGGAIQLRGPRFSAHTLGTTSANDPTFASLSLSGEVPESVREVMVDSELLADDIRALFAAEAAVGIAASVYPSSRANSCITDGVIADGEVGRNQQLFVPIDDPGTPAIAYAHQRFGASDDNVNTSELSVIGWR